MTRSDASAQVNALTRHRELATTKRSSNLVKATTVTYMTNVYMTNVYMIKLTARQHTLGQTKLATDKLKNLLYVTSFLIIQCRTKFLRA